MNQNSVLTENMKRQSTNDNLERPVETIVSTTNSQRSFIQESFVQEVLNLIKSVDQLTSQNFELLKGELLKIARVSGNDIGMG